MERLVALIVNDVKGKKIERIGFFHICNETEAKTLIDLLSQQLDLPKDYLFVEFTPGLSVHAGAGMIGTAIYAK
jgi:fatty acid-binding protein DegV